MLAIKSYNWFIVYYTRYLILYSYFYIYKITHLYHNDIKIKCFINFHICEYFLNFSIRNEKLFTIIQIKFVLKFPTTLNIKCWNVGSFQSKSLFLFFLNKFRLISIVRCVQLTEITSAVINFFLIILLPIYYPHFGIFI